MILNKEPLTKSPELSQTTGGAKQDRRSDDGRKSALYRIVRMLGVFSLAGTWIGCLATWFWIADFLTQLTIQWTLLLLCWSIPLVWATRWKMALVVLLSAGMNLAVIVPYFIPSASVGEPAKAKAGEFPVLRIAALNVLRTNTHFQETLEVVLADNPDVIYLSEVQPAWKEFLEAIGQDYPYQLHNPSWEYTGVALLSKLPLEEAETISVGKVANPTYDFTLVLSDRKLRVIATHPLPPLGGDLSDARDQQLRNLVQRFNVQQPRILLGDLNQSPWSPKFRQLLRKADLRDASLGYGIEPTLAPLPTWLGGVKVDHFLVSEDVSVLDYFQRAVPDSDHQLIVLDCQVR